MQKIKLYNGTKLFFQTPDDGYSYFFGYYDKCPLNKKGDKLLAHRVSFDGRDVTAEDMADVGYFDLRKGSFVKIGETKAFNWQQGAQLQWLPPDFEEKIIYNDRRNGKFVSVIYNLKTGEEKIIEFPIYVIHPKGKYALAVNYERLYFCRPGYNYQGVVNKKWDVPYHKEDGIFKVNLETGEVKQIVSTEDIVKVNPTEEILNSNNWLEHMMFNPSGNRFMFLHRWNVKGVDYTRLFTANGEDGSDIFMFPDAKFYSHADWKNNKEFAIWTLEPKLLNSKINSSVSAVKKSVILKWPLKMFYRGFKKILPKKITERISPISKLLLFKDKTWDYEVIIDDIFERNGHITWSKNKRYLLNDTYQDRDNYRHLMLYSIARKEIIMLGKFYSTYNDCGYRCDLHPRFSWDERYVIIDSAHQRRRKILILELSEEIRECLKED
jgi:hypothetical protein